jgi:Na+/H+-translocating membrane pyrophosphatase
MYYNDVIYIYSSVFKFIPSSCHGIVTIKQCTKTYIINNVFFGPFFVLSLQVMCSIVATLFVTDSPQNNQNFIDLVQLWIVVLLVVVVLMVEMLMVVADCEGSRYHRWWCGC